MLITKNKSLSEELQSIILVKGGSIITITKLNEVTLNNIVSTEVYNIIFVDEDIFENNDALFDCLFELQKGFKNFAVFTSKKSCEHKCNLLKSGALNYFERPIVEEDFIPRLLVLKNQIQQNKNNQRGFKLERVYTWFFNAIEHGMEAIEIWNLKGIIQYVNFAHSVMTGYSRWEMIGTNVFSYFSSNVEIETFISSAWKPLVTKNSSSWTGTLSMRRKNGAISVQEVTSIFFSCVNYFIKNFF